MITAISRPVGKLSSKVVKGIPGRELSLKELLYWTFPHADLDKETWLWRCKNWPRMVDQIWRLYAMKVASKVSGYPFLYGKLWVEYMPGSGLYTQRLGLVSLRAVTNGGVGDIVDEFDEATDDASLKLLNFHGIGTGTTSAVAGDTALETELTTEYTGDVRATGAQTQPSANVYQTLATNTLDSGTPAVTEQGVLSQAATGGGLLLDRHTFAAKNLDGTVGDALQTTYQLTVSAGG